MFICFWSCMRLSNDVRLSFYLDLWNPLCSQTSPPSALSTACSGKPRSAYCLIPWETRSNFGVPRWHRPDHLYWVLVRPIRVLLPLETLHAFYLRLTTLVARLCAENMLKEATLPTLNGPLFHALSGWLVFTENKEALAQTVYTWLSCEWIR